MFSFSLCSKETIEQLILKDLTFVCFESLLLPINKIKTRPIYMQMFYDAAVVPGEIIPCNLTIIKAMLLDVVVILIWYNHMKFLSFDYSHVSLNL